MSNDGELTEHALTLHQVAELLSVHYMTVYRYVRLGQLQAYKVGGSWRVRQSEVDAFRINGDARASIVTTEGARRDAPWADRFEQRLLAGDARGAWGVIESALAAGSSLEQAYLDVLSPALRSIGQRWAEGEIDIAVEHQATAIAVGLIGRLSALSARRGRSKGLVIVGAPTGERHSLPLAILAECVRLAGWDVSDLGADVPVQSFVYAVRNEPDAMAIGVSVTLDNHLAIAQEAVAAIRLVRSDIAIVLGGPAVQDDRHAKMLGADFYAADAHQLTSLLLQLAS